MSYEIDGVRLVDDVGNVYDIEEWLDMHGHVELPRDVNDIPIRVGNEVETIIGKRDEVRFMTLNGAGWLINEAGWLPTHLRHYVIDTWERIISDAVKLGFTDPDNEHLADKLVSRCKALASDDK